MVPAFKCSKISNHKHITCAGTYKYHRDSTQRIRNVASVFRGLGTWSELITYINYLGNFESGQTTMSNYTLMVIPCIRNYIFLFYCTSKRFFFYISLRILNITINIVTKNHITHSKFIKKITNNCNYV